MAAKIRPVRVTCDVDVARDFRVDFLKLAPSRDFETSLRAVKRTIGSHLKVFPLFRKYFALCRVRFVYVQDNVIARVLELVLTRAQVSVLLRPSCCERSLLKAKDDKK